LTEVSSHCCSVGGVSGGEGTVVPREAYEGVEGVAAEEEGACWRKGEVGGEIDGFEGLGDEIGVKSGME